MISVPRKLAGKSHNRKEEEKVILTINGNQKVNRRSTYGYTMSFKFKKGSICTTDVQNKIVKRGSTQHYTPYHKKKKKSNINIDNVETIMLIQDTQTTIEQMMSLTEEAYIHYNGLS